MRKSLPIRWTVENTSGKRYNWTGKLFCGCSVPNPDEPIVYAKRLSRWEAESFMRQHVRTKHAGYILAGDE